MMREQANCHGAASTCLSMPQASSYTLPPLNTSGCLGRTLYWLSHQVEQTHNEWYPSNRKTKYHHHLHIRATLTCFFLVTATILPPTAKRELLFHHRSCTPKFHHLFWKFSESFHQHSNDQTPADWVTRFSICASVSRRSTNFATICRIFSLSVKIRWHKLLHIPTSSANFTDS